MSRALPSDVWRLGDALTPAEKLVALALVDYGARAHPRQAVLAVKTGLSRATVQRALDALREKGVLSTTARGKALTYALDLRPDRPHGEASRCLMVRPEVPHGEAAIGLMVRQGSELVQGTSPPNQGLADAGTGWGGVPADVIETIRRRDPGADAVVRAQRHVCGIELASFGITDSRAVLDAWRLLCHAWAKSGRRPLDTARAVTERLDGARDPSAVVLHRLRGAA